MADPYTLLYNAILIDDVIAVRDVLLRYPELDLPNTLIKERKSPLIIAALSPSSAYVFYFLATLPATNVNLRDRAGWSALHHAASAGNVRAVKLLLKVEAQPDLCNKEGMTPLTLAAYNGHANICQILLRTGRVDVNKRARTKKTALALASYEGFSSVVRLLLSYGAKINVTDKHGWTPLMLACYAGKADVIKLLLRNGADPKVISKSGKTACIIAAECNHWPAVALFSPEDQELMRRFIKLPPVKSQLYPSEDYLSNLGPAGGMDDEAGGNMGSESNKESNKKGQPRKGLFAPLELGPKNKRVMPSYQILANSSSYTDYEVPNTVSFDPKNAKFVGKTEPTETRQQHKQHKQKKVAGMAQDMGKWWDGFSKAVTFMFCSCCLTAVGMRGKEVQQAWREKMALCFIILAISAMVGFLSFGISSIACHPSVSLFPADVQSLHGADANVEERLMSVRGRLYRVGPFFQYGFHRPILPLKDEDLAPIIRPFFGNDISTFFPADRSRSQCKLWPQLNQNDICGFGVVYPDVDQKYLHCHRSGESISALQKYYYGVLTYSWDNITASNGLFAYNGEVFDLSGYLQSNATHLGDAGVTAVLRSFVGRDITRDFQKNPQLADNLLPCLREQFIVGRISGLSVGCLVTNVVVIMATSILVFITLVKFISALIFDWLFSWKLGRLSTKPRDPDSYPYVVVLVTAYSENKEGLRVTFNSIAETLYSCNRKVMVVVADGLVSGAGNEKTTPELCLELMDGNGDKEEKEFEVDFDQKDFDDDLKKEKEKEKERKKERVVDDDVEPKSYVAVGEGPKRHNMAKVYTGTYSHNGRTLPYILVVKCGTPKERKDGVKPGNRGKRDSQLILMQFFSNIYANERISPLEFALFNAFKKCAGVSPEAFELALMVDADTKIQPESLGYMVSAMERDPMVMGLCGETRIANKTSSWVTMIQVYEYYISHHLGKAFESIFGGVTCLPGCFCMYRLKSLKKDGHTWIPLLCNPEVVQMYASNDVQTLHKKNLLLLGEDRYLTTLMLRAFPRRKMIFVPNAVCKTTVPEQFKVLLSQRRRWINSTIHNLLELIMVPQLCGIFCFSMQFVIFLELVGTVVLPAALLFLFYLVLSSIFGADVLLPLLFTTSMFLLQAILILMTTRKMIYIVWMFVFIFAIPIWNFVLPVYAFWHFDDFTWGKTRETSSGEANHLTENEITEEEWAYSVPTKTCQQWSRLEEQGDVPEGFIRDSMQRNNGLDDVAESGDDDGEEKEKWELSIRGRAIPLPASGGEPMGPAATSGIFDSSSDFEDLEDFPDPPSPKQWKPPSPPAKAATISSTKHHSLQGFVDKKNELLHLSRTLKPKLSMEPLKRMSSPFALRSKLQSAKKTATKPFLEKASSSSYAAIKKPLATASNKPEVITSPKATSRKTRTARVRVSAPPVLKRGSMVAVTSPTTMAAPPPSATSPRPAPPPPPRPAPPPPRPAPPAVIQRRAAPASQQYQQQQPQQYQQQYQQQQYQQQQQQPTASNVVQSRRIARLSRKNDPPS